MKGVLKTAVRRGLFPLLRLTRGFCLLICCILLLGALSPASTGQKACFETAGFSSRAYFHNERVELFGMVFILDANQILPIAEQAKTVLSAGGFYLDALTQTCVSCLSQTFGQVLKRLAEVLPKPQYHGNATLA